MDKCFHHMSVCEMSIQQMKDEPARCLLACLSVTYILYIPSLAPGKLLWSRLSSWCLCWNYKKDHVKQERVTTHCVADLGRVVEMWCIVKTKYRSQLALRFCQKDPLKWINPVFQVHY